MSGYRSHSAPQPLLLGYDPTRDLPADHLARLIEQVVEETVCPPDRGRQEGQPPFDPRLCLKVLLYGYATGTRSSRRLEQHCHESLPYLFLTRGDAPSYRTLCTARNTLQAELETVWEGLFAIAAARGLRRLGQIVLDSSRWRADASREATLGAAEFAEVLAELQRVLAEAEQADLAEESGGPRNSPQLGEPVPPEQVRDILRRVRRQRAARKRAETAAPGDPGSGSSSDPGGSGPGSPGRSGPTSDATGGTATAVPACPAEPPASEPPDVAPVAPARRLTPAMRRRLRSLLTTLIQAQQEQRKHLNLTDPDAAFMLLGSEKQLGLGHSFEAVVDQGLLVVGQRGVGSTDNARLEPLVAAAEQREPAGVTHVTADSGFYRGEPMGKWLRQGIDVCIPDSNTACDLHRGQPIGTQRGRTGEWAFLTWDAAAGLFRCQNDNVLSPVERREEHGQQWTVYRAQGPCTDCPYAGECLQRANAKYRTVRLGEYHAELEAARQQFGDPEFRERYHHRGEAIETVFGFIAQVLGYRRWSLRGKSGVQAEAKWIGLAYQTRKVHGEWAGA